MSYRITNHAYGYDQDYEPDYKCSDCEEHEKRLEHARDHFDGILKSLFGHDPINKDLLCDSLEEVAWILGCEFQRKNLNVSRPEEVRIIEKDPLAEWLNFNVKYLGTLK